MPITTATIELGLVGIGEGQLGFGPVNDADDSIALNIAFAESLYLGDTCLGAAILGAGTDTSGVGPGGGGGTPVSFAASANFSLVVELTLDGPETRRWSYEGISTPTAYFKPKIIEVGGLSRSVSLIPGDFSTSDVTIVFDNSDQEFSQIKAGYSIHNRVIDIKIGDMDVGFSSFVSVFCGKVRDWRFTNTTFEITAAPTILDRLDRDLSWSVNSDLFPDKPSDETDALIPLVFGDLDDDDGAVPAFLIDPAVSQSKYRYVAGLTEVNPDDVFKYGVSQSSGFTINHIAGPGDVGQITVIDFDADPRDSSRTNEREVTWNGQGLTSDGTTSGSLIVTAASQLKELLKLQGFVDADFNTASFLAADTQLAARGVTNAGAVADPAASIRQLIEDFARSANMGVFTDRTGLLAVSVPANNTTPVLTLREGVNIVTNSLEVISSEEKASSFTGSYSKSYVTGDFRSHTTYTDETQVTRLGEDVNVHFELPFVRDQGTMNKIASDRLFFMREGAQTVVVGVTLAEALSLELGDDLLLNHYAGLGSSGYQEANFRVAGINISANPLEFSATVVMVSTDEASFAQSKEWLLLTDLPIKQQYSFGVEDQGGFVSWTARELVVAGIDHPAM